MQIGELNMGKIDLQYTCTVMGNLSGIPIRIYKNGKLAFYHSIVNLPIDPICINQDAILAIDNHIGYFVNSYFSYYGIVKSGNQKVVIGPTRQIPLSEQELKEIAFKADVPSSQIDDFVVAMRSIIPMPLESIMQILCVLNHVLNGEKTELKDVSIFEDKQKEMETFIEQSQVDETISSQFDHPNDLHNTISIENTIQAIVSKGDVQALKDWVTNAPAVRGGTVAQNQLRQLKNIFIVTATLVSRAAISGGMDVEDSMSLSDMYIQKCELLKDLSEIINLQYRMVVDYTERVANIRKGKSPTKLALDVANYVRHHLSEVITTDAIANELYLSRAYLSSKFKSDTGENLSDFIQKEKIAEAKRLLRYTDKPLISISSYLGFSSQSHFNRVFKSITGKTPKEYRLNG